MPIAKDIPFDNSFAKEMPGFFAEVQGSNFPDPKILIFNDGLASELSLDVTDLKSDGAALFAGTELPVGAAGIAQVYAGHQFGGFSEQLGDGRALLLGEVLDRGNKRRDIQLKGSGPTPFSRGGDGKAAIGPVLREYLMSEAMNALGVPTTRALAVVTTGEAVLREEPEAGAVLTRVASSHIRVGTFQYFAARGETDKVKQLADYTIKRHYPHLEGSETKYVGFLEAVQEAQAELIAKWVSLGFVHGVMNTDNVTISGETIDYGPCAFIDRYDPKAVFSSIDTHGRYAYGKQPIIAQWNLARFAETLIPLIDPETPDNALKIATNILNMFPSVYQVKWASEMHLKLGLGKFTESNAALINELHTIMEAERLDFTTTFRDLADVARGHEHAFMSRVKDKKAIRSWLVEWRDLIIASGGNLADHAREMDFINPSIIPRNHKVHEAIKAAETGDMAPFQTLLDLVKNPYDKHIEFESYKQSAPDGFGPYVTFCGT